MKNIFKKVTYAFFLMAVSMVMFLSSAFAQDLSAILPAKVDAQTIWVALAIMIWEFLVANNKGVKSNSTIDMVISGLKKFLGLDRYTKK